MVPALVLDTMDLCIVLDAFNVYLWGQQDNVMLEPGHFFYHRKEQCFSATQCKIINYMNNSWFHCWPSKIKSEMIF